MKNRAGSKDRGWQGWVCSSDTACGILDGGLGGEYLTYTDASGREGLNLQDIWGKCSPGWGLEAGFWLRRWVVRTGTVVEAEWGWEWSFPHFHSPAYDLFLHLCFFLSRASPSFWWLSGFFFPLQLFLISQNCRVVCSSVSFYMPAFPFSVSLSVFSAYFFLQFFCPGTYSYYNSSQTLVQHF